MAESLSEARRTLRRLRRRLADLPAQRAVFDAVLDSLRSRRSLRGAPPVGVAVYGSLADGGPIDALSDLDLAVVVPDRRSFNAVRRAFGAALAGCGRLVAGFRASATAHGEQLVGLCDVDGTVVKVDVQVATLRAFAGVAAASRLAVVDDPRRQLRAAKRRAPRTRRPQPDVGDLVPRAVGALWNAHVRIERGDRLEAVELLAQARREALVPLLLGVERLPPREFRGLERALPPARLRALRATYPRGFQRTELRRALRAAVRLLCRLGDALPRVGARRSRPALECLEAAIGSSHRRQTWLADRARRG